MRPGTIPTKVADPEAPVDSSAPGAPAWRRRWRVFRERASTLSLVGFGVVALLLALLLWRTFRTDDKQIVATDVEEAVAQALASATASPVVSAQVYQAILPSLVVVQTDNGGEGNGFGIGTGVVVNSDAEVLTALHIIEGASEIQLAFADGTRTSAAVTNVDPERDIAVLTPAVLPNFVLARDHRQLLSDARRRRGVRSGQPAGPGGLVECGRSFRDSTATSGLRAGRNPCGA